MNIEFFLEDFPEIDLGDIILRQIEEFDLDEYFYYMNHEKMAGFLTKDNRPKTPEEALSELKYWRNLFASKRSIYWAIALKKTNQMIGTIGFNIIHFEHNKCDISYDLSPDYWGKGVMYNALVAVMAFADHKIGVVRTQATVITDNKRSIKLLEKCSFEKEGCMKKYEIVDGSHKDYFMYSRVTTT